MTYHGTTILAVRHQGRTAVAGDGQVTLNASVIKHRAKKVGASTTTRSSSDSPGPPPTP